MSSCFQPVILPSEPLHSKHTLPTPGASRTPAFATAGPSPGKPSPTSTFSSHSLIQQRFIEHPPRARNISAILNPSRPSTPSALPPHVPHPCFCTHSACSAQTRAVGPSALPFTAHPRGRALSSVSHMGSWTDNTPRSKPDIPEIQ